MTDLSLSSKTSLPPPPVIGVLVPALLPEVTREGWTIQSSGNSVCGYWVGGRSHSALCYMWVSPHRAWYMVSILKLEFTYSHSQIGDITLYTGLVGVGVHGAWTVPLWLGTVVPARSS